MNSWQEEDKERRSALLATRSLNKLLLKMWKYLKTQTLIVKYISKVKTNSKIKVNKNKYENNIK